MLNNLYFESWGRFPRVTHLGEIIPQSISKVGDYIKVNSAEGQVIRRGLVETLIQTKQGDVIYIPNASLIKQEIVKLRHHAK